MSDDFRRADDIQIKVLEERVNLWMESTTEYRKSLCAKLDIVLHELQDLKEAKMMAIIKEISGIRETIAKLPCDARRPMWDSLNKQVTAIWGFIGAIIVAITVKWIYKQ